MYRQPFAMEILLMFLMVVALLPAEGSEIKDDAVEVPRRVVITWPETGEQFAELTALQRYRRIVGGAEADHKKHPYQLQLGHDGQLFCGASIISKNWALTAAHCLLTDGKLDWPKSALTLRAGAPYRDYGGKIYKISKVIVHDKYSEDELDYDIALLKVKTPFVFGPRVQKVALPHKFHKVVEGDMAVVSGWGHLVDQGKTSDFIQKVTVPIMRQKECWSNYRKEEMFLTDRMICAGRTKGQKGFCNGDSGGPLVIEGKQVGIVSWSKGCAAAGLPNVFTKVAPFRDWIRLKTGI